MKYHPHPRQVKNPNSTVERLLPLFRRSVDVPYSCRRRRPTGWTSDIGTDGDEKSKYSQIRKRLTYPSSCTLKVTVFPYFSLVLEYPGGFGCGIN